MRLNLIHNTVYTFARPVAFNPHRLVLRMGVDSVAVLVLYAVGIVGLIAVNNS